MAHLLTYPCRRACRRIFDSTLNSRLHARSGQTKAVGQDISDLRSTLKNGTERRTTDARVRAHMDREPTRAVESTVAEGADVLALGLLQELARLRRCEHRQQRGRQHVARWRRVSWEIWAARDLRRARSARPDVGQGARTRVWAKDVEREGWRLAGRRSAFRGCRGRLGRGRSGIVGPDRRGSHGRCLQPRRWF